MDGCSLFATAEVGDATRMQALVVDDSAVYRKLIGDQLRSWGFEVTLAECGSDAWTLLQQPESPKLVLLDWVLPDLDGIELCKRIRVAGSTGPYVYVILLTGKEGHQNMLDAMQAGADDFLAKPFSFSELSARIRALVRRSHVPSESVLVAADLRLDRVQRLVERAGRRIELTGKEFSLLEYLMLNAGRQVSRSMIIEHVWNLTFDTTTNVVDVYINYGVRVTEVAPSSL